MSIKLNKHRKKTNSVNFIDVELKYSKVVAESFMFVELFYAYGLLQHEAAGLSLSPALNMTGSFF